MSFALTGRINNLEADLDNAIINKADATNAVFQGTEANFNCLAKFNGNALGQKVSGLSKSDVGLSNVDNTSDANKPVSIATQAAINTMRDSIVNGAPLVLDTLKELADAIGNDQNYAANLLTILEKTGATGPTGSTMTNIYTNDLMQIKVKGSTGPPIASFSADSIQFNTPVSGVTKSMVGLGQVDNTSDANKPLSNAMKQIIEQVGNDTRLYVNVGDAFLIQDATGFNPIATFNNNVINLNKTVNASTLSTSELNIYDSAGPILSVGSTGIRPFRAITPTNGFLYNKAEIDGSVNFIESRIDNKQDDLYTYASVDAGDAPPSSS